MTTRISAAFFRNPRLVPLERTCTAVDSLPLDGKSFPNACLATIGEGSGTTVALTLGAGGLAERAVANRSGFLNRTAVELGVELTIVVVDPLAFVQSLLARDCETLVALRGKSFAVLFRRVAFFKVFFFVAPRVLPVLFLATAFFLGCDFFAADFFVAAFLFDARLFWDMVAFLDVFRMLPLQVR